MTDLVNLRVTHVSALLPPSCLVEELPGDEEVYGQVVDTRQHVLEVLKSTNRLLVVICHNGSAENLLQLAKELADLSSSVGEQLLVVLQPDKSLIWSASSHNQGVRQTRSLLLQVNHLGVPTACEFDDTVTPQYFADLLSWASVDARSEMLCELVSGLSMPVGLQATVTEADCALHALKLSASGHHFVGVSSEGLCGIVESTGNRDTHVVLEAAVPDKTDPRQAPKAAAALLTQAQALVLAESGSPLLFETGTGSPHWEVLSAALVAHLGAIEASSPRGVRLRLGAPSEWKRAKAFVVNLAVAVKATQRSKPRAHALGATSYTEPPDNLRVSGVRPLIPAACLVEELPREEKHAAIVRRARSELQQILRGDSKRLVVIAGPPIVGSPDACREYAARMADLALEVKEHVLLVMRVQLTQRAGAGAGAGVAWRGPLKDPDRDGSYHFNRGLKLGRELLLQVSDLGLPTACEFDDTVTPQYFADLLSCATVDARSEMLCKLVSGLSMPVGLRSDSDHMAAAESTLQDTGRAQDFFGVTPHGIAGIVHATGNADCVIMLNTDAAGSAAERAAAACSACESNGCGVVVECGGPNTSSWEQADLAAQLCSLIESGSIERAASSKRRGLVGVALSSFLLSGSRPHTQALPGISETDPCMDWLQTSQAVRGLAAACKSACKAAAAGHAGKAAKKPRVGA